jgi:hypothetical protein
VIGFYGCMNSDRRLAVAALTTAGLLWGTTVPLSKVALDWLPSGWLTFVRFGLAAAVWTRDIGRAIRMSEGLQAGTVWVNTYRAVSFMAPFGGYKDSGLGRENGIDAVREYLQTKSVWINSGAVTGNPFVLR